ncbi:MAG: hypothetical protein F6K02_27685 [Moorea sp. SIO3A5]|nr:hypothetical protein [Moorena sp. SIO3A5]
MALSSQRITRKEVHSARIPKVFAYESREASAKGDRFLSDHSTPQR